MKNVIACMFLFLFGISLYVLTVRGVPGDIDMTKVRDSLDVVSMPLELSPERGRYVLTYSLAERGTFGLDEQLATVADPDVGYYKGTFYIYFAPGISVLAVPFYLIGKMYNIPQVAAFFTISFFAALNLLLIYLLSRKVFTLPIAFSLFAALVFGFASTSWSYAITLYQHHVTTFFILSAFLAVHYYRTSEKLKWFFASYVWTAYGLSIFLDYPNAILMAPVIGFLIYSSVQVHAIKKKLQFSLNLTAGITSIFFLALIGLHGYYNYVHFDSWTKLSGSLIGFDRVREVRKDDKNVKKEVKIEELANQKGSATFFEEENVPRGFAILTTSPDRGLFLFSPIFLLALLGIYKKIKKSITAETFFLLSIIFVNLFLYSSWGDPWGGWAFGPRYLIPTMAIGSSFIAYCLHKNRHPIFSRLVAVVLFIISSAIALLGALTTNQVPPKVEADFYGINYNFFLNLEYFLQGKSSSFVFNNYIVESMSLMHFYVLVLLVLATIASLVIFLAPVKDAHEN